MGSETLTLETGSVTASFDDQNVGTGKTVTASDYAISDGTGLASNYILESTIVTTSADILPDVLSSIISSVDIPVVNNPGNSLAVNGEIPLIQIVDGAIRLPEDEEDRLAEK